MNTLGVELVDEFENAFRRVDEATTHSPIVLISKPRRRFIAGADIEQFVRAPVAADAERASAAPARPSEPDAARPRRRRDSRCLPRGRSRGRAGLPLPRLHGPSADDVRRAGGAARAHPRHGRHAAASAPCGTPGGPRHGSHREDDPGEARAPDGPCRRDGASVDPGRRRARTCPRDRQRNAPTAAAPCRRSGESAAREQFDRPRRGVQKGPPQCDREDARPLSRAARRPRRRDRRLLGRRQRRRIHRGSPPLRRDGGDRGLAPARVPVLRQQRIEERSRRPEPALNRA